MNAIAKRQARDKQTLIDQLNKTPIIHVACEKTAIARATYYRWRKDDEKFAAAADEAIHEGERIINDMAESQLISAIRDKNMTAIIFWLKSHHPLYANKVEVTGRIKHEYKLSDEEETLITKALSMMSSGDSHATT